MTTLAPTPPTIIANSAPRLTLSVDEAANALGIGRGLAYEMVRNGSLPSLRLGQRRIVIPRAALEAMLAGVGRALEN